MRYIVCDDCGGYYKLEEDESLEDFDECQCGGNLRYAASFRDIVKDRDAPTILCIHCGAENKETDTNCVNCGEKLRKINRRISDYQVKRPMKTQISILDRISFTGLIAGLVFLLIATIIAVFGVVGSVISTGGMDLFRSLGGYLIIMVFAIIGSGFIASYISGTKDYIDGLLNGAMVGLTLSILGALLVTIITMTMDVLGGLIAGIVTLVVYGLIYGTLTGIGGLVAPWLRKNMEDY
ncbi:MAG: TIGR04086 family membrane protein [Methanobacterium sp.]|nr:TIGR04086 family membrane protein [Methanobacterium sp.]